MKRLYCFFIEFLSASQIKLINPQETAAKIYKQT